MRPLWDLFQAGFVFQNIRLQTVPPLLHCLHQPPLATVLSSPQLEHWSRTSVSLCGLDASTLPLGFSPLLFIRSSLCSSVRPERSCRFTKRLGNTHRLSLHDNALRNNGISTIGTPWEPRPPCNRAQARQKPKTQTLTLLCRDTRGGDDWGALSWQMCVCVCVCVCACECAQLHHLKHEMPPGC